MIFGSHRLPWGVLESSQDGVITSEDRLNRDAKRRIEKAQCAIDMLKVREEIK
jgi:hypothetical protein